MTQSEDLKINFIDLMTHDLKSSIVKIQSICSRLELENISRHHIQDIKNIYTTSCEMSHFINNILKVIQVDSGHFHINKEPTDVNETIENVIQKIDALAKKNIIIEKTLEPLFLVELDAAIIKEIFFNVIENAIKYSNVGGRIFVRTYEEDNPDGRVKPGHLWAGKPGHLGRSDKMGSPYL